MRSAHARSANWIFPVVPTPVVVFVDMTLSVAMTWLSASYSAASTPRSANLAALSIRHSCQTRQISSKLFTGTAIKPCTIVSPSYVVRISSLPALFPDLEPVELHCWEEFELTLESSSDRSFCPPLPFFLSGSTSPPTTWPQASAILVPANKSLSRSLCTSTMVMVKESWYRSRLCSAMENSCAAVKKWTPYSWMATAGLSDPSAPCPPRDTVRSPTRVCVFPHPLGP
mmetsp:Transcript_37466/g.69287  ORF Transcript_37466/g.69287 Transcript_37466/m.69287 type:complete len:228 (+) Transcript_37466:485-1168(+)